eukprot:m.161225 g.161225  ORF g.161225 m.161225 type:complete len:180 (+) comp23830_c0_seq2:440-979(+)
MARQIHRQHLRAADWWVSRSTAKIPTFMFRGHVSGFTLSNLNVLLPGGLNNGIANALEFNVVSAKADERQPRSGLGLLSPTNGRIINITTHGGQWGYGLAQLQSGDNLHFENLESRRRWRHTADGDGDWRRLRSTWGTSPVKTLRVAMGSPPSCPNRTRKKTENSRSMVSSLLAAVLVC